MKILVVADTHGELQPHQLPQETLFIKPDGIFLLGDVFINDIELLKQFYPTVSMLGVGGNHDKWDLLKSANVQDIHGRVVRWNGLYIAGFDAFPERCNGTIEQHAKLRHIVNP